MIGKIYTTYEEPFVNQKFTTKQMKEIYTGMVDKTEYPDFTCWFSDMLRNAIFIEN